MKRTVIITLLTLLFLTGALSAQNPVSIAQVGTTPVTTTVPVSGTVTSNAGSGTFAVSGTVTANAGTGTFDVSCSSGCSGGTTDTDDGTIAAGQSTGLMIGISQVFDGTNWKRFTIGTAGTASSQVLTVQGIAAMTPILSTVTGNLTNISGTISLPTGAATVAKQPALGTAGTAASDVITVQGISSMTPILATVTGNLTNISGTISLPTGAATATNQTGGSQKTQIVDGSGNVIASTSNNLNVQCANCSGSGASAVDEATFTAGSSVFAPGGGFFQTTATSNALTNGQQGTFQLTATRAIFSNLRNAAGTEVGTSTTPLQVSLANTGANTNKLLVTPDSVALPANQSVNVNQLAGTTTDTNSGNKSAGTLRVVLATDQPALTNKLLVTPDSVALPANQSVNVNQLAGTTTDTNSGVKSAGTLRVVLATDQPALTNKLLVTPDSVALPNNQSVNVSQINGVTPLMGNGATGTGAIRVSIANDSTGIVALTTGSAQIGHLEANQSSNVAQINGVTPLMGAGNTGTGSQRVTIASDQVIIPTYTATTAVTTDSTLGCYLQSGASTNATNCKGSAGNFYGVRAVNTTATLYFLRLYNSSGTPTCSSATGFIESIPIPAATSGAGIMAVVPIPIGYSTGIGFCFTGGGSSTDNTNAATGVYLTVYYK